MIGELTEAEVHIVNVLALAWNLYCELPVEHGMERFGVIHSVGLTI
jgi:hypothetical protein